MQQSLLQVRFPAACYASESALRAFEICFKAFRQCAISELGWIICLPMLLVVAGDHSGGIWLWDPVSGKPLGQCRVRQWRARRGLIVVSETWQ